MIYEARYGGAAYDAALVEAAESAASDRYYRSPAGFRRLPGFPFPCGCTGERSDGSPDSPSADNIRDFAAVRWLSCRGNLAEYRFNHSRREVIFFVSGSRHGVPFRRLEGIEPLEVIRYYTTTPHWKWWETLDDHPEDLADMVARFGVPEIEPAE